MTIGNWVDSALTQIPHVGEEERRRAARLVAAAATSATDAAELLDALGLTAEDGLRPVQANSAPPVATTA